MSDALSDPATDRQGRSDGRPEGSWLAASWGSIALTLLAFAMLLWTHKVGRDLGMADTLSQLSWARAQYSTGIAISRLRYGVPGYLILTQVWEALRQRGFYAGEIDYLPLYPNQGIADALNLTIDDAPPPGSPPLYLDDWGDDKGNADYFMLAFGLFGFNIQALYHLYFLILGISLLLFTLQFFKSPGYLVFAPLFLASHHLAVITLLDNLVTSTVHDAHFLPAVGCLASLHLALMLVRSERNTWLSAPLLVVQAAIIVLVLGSRPSAIWLVLFPIGVCALWLAVMVLKRRPLAQVGRYLLRSSPIILLLLAGPKLLGVYQSLAFDRIYTESGIEGHMVWHSLYMGLSVHPDGPRYDLAYTDATSYNAGFRYLMQHPELARQLNVDTSSLTFDPKYTQTWITDVVGFRKYEEIGKHNFLSFVAEHPRYVAESLLFYKPKYLVEQILWQAGVLAEWPAWVKIELAHAPPSRHLLDLLSLPSAAVVVLAVVVACASGGAKSSWTWVALSGLLFLASLLPSIVVAPIYYELPVVFGLAAMLAYALGAAALVPIVRSAADVVNARSVQPARVRLAASMAVVLAMPVVGLQGRPLYAGDAALASATMPGRLPRELIQDSSGQVWLLAFDNTRSLMPDWDTYVLYRGDPAFRGVREVDTDDLRDMRSRGVAPSLASKFPDLPDAPFTRGRPLESGVVSGSVEPPAGSVNLALGRPVDVSEPKTGHAPRVVDGITGGPGMDDAAATIWAQEGAAWWQVDLGESQPIGTVQIWPRDGPGVDALHNVLVFVSERRFSSVEPRKLRRQAGVKTQFVLGRLEVPTTVLVNGRGRFVRIAVPRSGSFELAEVQVWSDPSRPSGR